MRHEIKNPQCSLFSTIFYSSSKTANLTFDRINHKYLENGITTMCPTLRTIYSMYRRFHRGRINFSSDRSMQSRRAIVGCTRFKNEHVGTCELHRRLIDSWKFPLALCTKLEKSLDA